MAAAHEAELLMDRIYRHQRHIYDLTRKFYLLGRDRLIRALDAGPGMAILEVGCGTGRNLIAAARAHPDAHVYGFDISGAMLATARSAVARAGLSRRITIAQADAVRFDPRSLFGRAAFDRIFFSYTLSMIPPWQAALAHAARMLADDGRLLVVDFGRMERLPAALRALQFGWLRRFHVEPRRDLDLALQSLASVTGAGLRFERLWRGYASYAELRLGDPMPAVSARLAARPAIAAA
jgi:S-adenosylmethionine-diacylgycerolhomoserine-N-methlytransferase